MPLRFRSINICVSSEALTSKTFNVSSGGKLILLSGIVKTQTDLDLRCRHMPTCTNKTCVKRMHKNRQNNNLNDKWWLGY